MAPLRPLPSASTAPRKSILKKTTEPTRSQSDSLLFPTTKRDKRAIKHAQLMSRVEKSAKPRTRKRRPNKKLATTLDDLVDALPGNDEADGVQESVAGSRVHDQVNVIKRKSMRSRPGAMKRREKLDKGERDRFAKNLAQMSAAKTDGDTGSAAPPQTTDRWKALRGFISQTMEKKPELANGGG